MPRSKYEDICNDLRRAIVEGAFADGMLPTEAQLTERFGASRNTVRRAVECLAREGYVQSQRGRGVVILDRIEQASDVDLDIRNFSGMRGTSRANVATVETRVLTLGKVVIDEELARRTHLALGAEACQIQRLRICDGHPWIVDHSWFLSEVLRDLTLEVAERSIYQHLEEHLGRKVIAMRRTIGIRRANDHDREHLELDGCNCVGVILNHAYIDSGQLFEFTETRYSPEHFTFTEFINR